jgi:hypothetical protein
VDDQVEHAALEQERRALRLGWQLLLGDLLDHPRAGEADQRALLGDQHVAHAGVAGRHAAQGRVGQDGDVRHAGRAELRQGRDRLGHLHQREDALVHARAAGRIDRHQRRAAGQRALGGAGDLLAHDAAHAGGHEAKVEHDQLQRQAVEARAAADGRLAFAGPGAGLDQLLRVLLAVGHKGERIAWRQLDVTFLKGLVVDQLGDAFARPKTRVVLALVAHLEIVLELADVQQLSTPLVFAPHPQL